MSHHPTITVQVGKQRAEIDVLIADLIRQMWIAGIRTEESCQRDPGGLVFVWLTSESDLRKLLNILADPAQINTPGSMYRRMSVHEDEEDIWFYRIFPHDANSGFAGRMGKFSFSISLEFPQRDIDEITERLKKYNEAENHHPCYLFFQLPSSQRFGIVAKEFWEEHHHLDDQSHLHALKEQGIDLWDFHEPMESFVQHNGSYEEGYRRLLELRFTEMQNPYPDLDDERDDEWDKEE